MDSVADSYTPPSEKSAQDNFLQAVSSLPELILVEAQVRSAFKTDVPSMLAIPEYLLSLGGKRIRPILVLLCGRALGLSQIPQSLIEIAAGIELIHMATLLHDDIIDRSPIRRHQPSPYIKFGTNTTLLSGDFLLTRAFGLCGRLDDTVIRATEEACIELVEGEALEAPLCEGTNSIEISLTIARRKTASLFRLAAFCAAHIAEHSEITKKALAEFGEKLGIAFQIIDDILDVVSDEATLGKRPGVDLIERKPSIVNVLWLASEDKTAKRLLTPPLFTPDTEEEAFVKSALEILKVSAAITDARSLALKFATEARTALGTAIAHSSKPCNQEAVQALNYVIDFAIDRMR